MNILKEWDSISQISKELNIQKSGISKCCSGKLETSGGFKWKYK